MGIEKCLIVGEVGKENCDCSICDGLLDDAVLIKGCEHYFCKECIEKEIVEAVNRGPTTRAVTEKRVECPVCKDTVFRRW